MEMNKTKMIVKSFVKDLISQIRRATLATNYYMGNYKDVIWLVGDGRSGTTWVSNIINYRREFRDMFEPFHPKLIEEMQRFSFYQYIKPDDTGSEFYDIASDVFSGKFTNKRADRQNQRLFYSGILIKDIFANLIISWAIKQFPHIKVVLIIRNPFAVALSKYKTRHYNWPSDHMYFLNQKSLYHDHLKPFKSIIENVGDNYIHRQVLYWAIIHYVLFRQLKPNQVHTIFYEVLFKYPQKEAVKLLRYLKPKEIDPLDVRLTKILKKPSRSSIEKSNLLLNRSPLNQWKKELSAYEIDGGMRILKHFGLDQLYGDDLMPNKDVLEKLLLCC